MNRLNRVGEINCLLKIPVMIVEPQFERQYVVLPMPGLLLDAMEGDFAAWEPKCIRDQQSRRVREDNLHSGNLT